MRRLLAVLTALAWPCAALSAPKEWNCSAEAAFAGGRVMAGVVVRQPGRPLDRSDITYTPAGSRDDFNFMESFRMSKPGFTRLPDPELVQVIVPTPAHTDVKVTLTIAGRTFVPQANPFDLPEPGKFFRFSPDHSLLEALSQGGQAELAYRSKDGRLAGSQTLTFATSAELLDAASKAYSAAFGFASDPTHSEYCDGTSF
jgi:hypothetical protein